MNVEGDFRYVTAEGLEEFKIWADWYSVGTEMKLLCDELEKNLRDLFEGMPHSFNGVKAEFSDEFRARIAALRSTGLKSARFLSKNVTVLVIGNSVFIHGGLLLSHLSYGLDRINVQVKDWIINGSSQGRRYPPVFYRGRNGVVWLRSFSAKSLAKCDCETLEHMLAMIRAQDSAGGDQWHVRGSDDKDRRRNVEGMHRWVTGGVWKRAKSSLKYCSIMCTFQTLIEEK